LIRTHPFKSSFQFRVISDHLQVFPHQRYNVKAI
jgi:hypothetical protein